MNRILSDGSLRDVLVGTNEAEESLDVEHADSNTTICTE